MDVTELKTRHRGREITVRKSGGGFYVVSLEFVGFEGTDDEYRDVCELGEPFETALAAVAEAERQIDKEAV
jgi:hypothetical protein